MQRPLQIGITGGIGSGKSLVCRIFGCLGIRVYDADSRARELMGTDPVLIQQIKNAFGEKAYTSGGKLDRTYLAQTVFGITTKLESLNRLVHPRVIHDYKEWVEANRDQHYLIKEAALIFEAGSSDDLDKTIVVTAPEELRVNRVLRRDRQRTENEVQKIIQSQMPEQEKIKRADFVIVNDESRLVIPQVLELHQRWTR